jgi:Txe/YoeB family toxin of toxin-antitoxin system
MQTASQLPPTRCVRADTDHEVYGLAGGTGKPEPLRRNLAGFWSRRIDDEHRLVYGATDAELIIIQARYHYDG